MTTLQIIQFKVCDSTRKLRKIIIAKPTIEAVIEKGNYILYYFFVKITYFDYLLLAKAKNLFGVRLVLEIEGHDVDDDEVLLFHQKDQLMLLGDNEDWVKVCIYFCSFIRILFM